jgi:hypothetical protein
VDALEDAPSNPTSITITNKIVNITLKWHKCRGTVLVCVNIHLKDSWRPEVTVSSHGNYRASGNNDGN